MCEPVPGLGVVALDQPEQRLKSMEAAGVPVALVGDGVEPGLDFGMQGRIVGPQQCQQAEQAVAAAQENLPLAAVLAIELQ